MGQQVQVNLTLRDGADIDAVATALAAAGLVVGQLLRGIGVISGEADEDVLDALGRLEGVASLERARKVRLPPPSSPIQ